MLLLSVTTPGASRVSGIDAYGLGPLRMVGSSKRYAGGGNYYGSGVAQISREVVEDWAEADCRLRLRGLHDFDVVMPAWLTEAFLIELDQAAEAQLAWTAPLR
ncbi:hypothetical protein [Engelhardtia mirabilis]|uniref:Uncharacterized protein n=1 Tax=Engelhardtia mirabilis TaxID=2528011 RepID=A0A518BL75_9BACT|nr:hypothetical protein Pla133_28170 [Planctomycetes bacterium Pla133]QDV02055.1 hypothetical protein Pla86_28160 [Planctomycetes bacterium Pla86]